MFGILVIYVYRTKQCQLDTDRLKLLTRSTGLRCSHLSRVSTKMASASSTSARSLFVDSKLRLADRVQVNVNNIASVARQINRGSKSSEVLLHAARGMAILEHAIETTEDNLTKADATAKLLSQEVDSVQNSALMIEEINEQVRAMQR